LFATGLMGWIAWFCRDAWLSDNAIENLILIVPASAVALLLYLFVAAGCFKPVETATPASPRTLIAPGLAWKIGGSMVLLAGFAVAGPLIGFDVASFVYLLAMLLLLGERRIWVLVLAPLIFSALAIYCFGTLLATPLPMLFFGEAG
jgi:hypothetical protein